MNSLINVSSSPHIRSPQNISSIMRDVIIALMPALAASVFIFGIRSLVITLTAILSCVAFESLWNTINKKEETIGDLSAAVTGVLLAFSMPPSAPLWLVIVGSFFAIVIVKQLFGGLGHNFVNPALAARGFMVASWPAIMTAWTAPFAGLSAFGIITDIDAVATATPLAIVKGGGTYNDYLSLFFGTVGGCIGETSVLALLIGAVYLMYKKVITLHAPLAYILSAGVLGYVLGYGNSGWLGGDFMFHILSGALFIGAFYMITDYTTSPVTPMGQVVSGIIAGLITAVIRVKGGYPEGITYAILFANILSPQIDKFIVPKKFGGGVSDAK